MADTGLYKRQTWLSGLYKRQAWVILVWIRLMLVGIRVMNA